MTSSNTRCLLISDFNVQPLADCLEQDQGHPSCEVAVAPFGQVTPVLVDLSSGASQGYDALLVWTQPETAIPGYEALVRYETVSESVILSQVDGFTQQLLKTARQVEHVFVVNWSQPYFRRGLGIWSMRREGCTRTLMKMNLELCDQLSSQSNVYVLDPSAWLAAAGRNAFNAKLWYLAKVPFNPEVFAAAAKDVKAALNAIKGRTKKLIVLDLDDTLWGGMVGEVGWENVRIGGHDPIGEAYADFQKSLKALVRNGTVLAIASKNEEPVALEAIDKHPEMILRRSDFAAWRINWSDKAENIMAIAAELNLDPSAIVYIDDSPFERNRVRSALPSVSVPEWPQDVFLYTSTLNGLPYFDKVAITPEDRQRTTTYIANIQRAEAQKAFQSVADWLESLEMQVSVEELSQVNLPRAAQLFNKTNQMNLCTRRLAERDLWNWYAMEGNYLYVFRASDKFGDYGLTGILGLTRNGEYMTLSDYLLSCRVMGRGVEELMLAVAIGCARDAGVEEVRAEYIPTPKNAPCLAFFRTKSGFQTKADYSFVWRTSDRYANPSHIVVNRSHARAT